MRRNRSRTDRGCVEGKGRKSIKALAEVVGDGGRLERWREAGEMEGRWRDGGKKKDVSEERNEQEHEQRCRKGNGEKRVKKSGRRKNGSEMDGKGGKERQKEEGTDIYIP
ncbi:hypothetical protein Pmani_019701 [Petrolisthes manimaculis]|uniref:Uncharacterized protein n=1 Tax=Petrolisthes manimaculis TaxID=1843537 RepID=A0AAE1PK62_9EUCA|nr:hypothetical protein Pmani_019701 [Petrolisthes manimaculis]